jgi:hypothetical protein
LPVEGQELAMKDGIPVKLAGNRPQAKPGTAVDSGSK